MDYALSFGCKKRPHLEIKLTCPLCRQTFFFWPTLKKILVDRGYRGEIADQVESDFMIEPEISNTPDGTRGFNPKLLRWGVERTFAWLDGFRRLSRNYE